MNYCKSCNKLKKVNGVFSCHEWGEIQTPGFESACNCYVEKTKHWNSRAKLNAGELERGTEFSAGYDLKSTHSAVVYPGEYSVISTGVFIEIQEGYEGQVRGRSGLNFKHNIVCPVGTIDSDYRGEVKVKLYNLGTKTFKIEAGDRIAQMIIAKHYDIEGATVKDVQRADNGFGSTGIS